MTDVQQTQLALMLPKLVEQFEREASRAIGHGDLDRVDDALQSAVLVVLMNRMLGGAIFFPDNPKLLALLRRRGLDFLAPVFQ